MPCQFPQNGLKGAVALPIHWRLLSGRSLANFLKLHPSLQVPGLYVAEVDRAAAAAADPHLLVRLGGFLGREIF